VRESSGSAGARGTVRGGRCTGLPLPVYGVPLVFAGLLLLRRRAQKCHVAATLLLPWIPLALTCWP
jgi:hypothetical protein